jgi:hypothetical protein
MPQALESHQFFRRRSHNLETGGILGKMLVWRRSDLPMKVGVLVKP